MKVYVDENGIRLVDLGSIEAWKSKEEVPKNFIGIIDLADDLAREMLKNHPKNFGKVGSYPKKETKPIKDKYDKKKHKYRR